MLQIIIITPLVLIAIFELADYITYKSFLKENKLDILSKKLNDPCLYSKGMIHWKALDFASKKFGISSRWFIHNSGENKRIFITSKMNKILDEKYKELKKEELNKLKISNPLFN